MIAASIRPLVENKKLPCRGYRHEFVISGKRADIERLHMARQPAIGIIIPQHGLRAIRHMLMAEGTRLHGLQYRRLNLPPDLECQLDRRAIAILFVGALRTVFSNDPIGQQGRLGTEPVAKVSFQGFLL